ncbi:MAG: hypothetical protein Q4B69_04530, partial [Slackia sp.]|nr:hypothetical protein [Slackia sp.]
AEKFARAIIKRAASLKIVKIDRGVFLRTELKKHCPDIDADFAVETTPAQAGVPAHDIDRIAKAAIDFETKKCAGLSFLAGIPGGVALAGTVPADLAQYFAHVMRIEQKLAYLYGWQTFLGENDEIDDETIMELVILMGVMLEVGGAANTLTKFAATTARQGVQRTIQRQALTKTTFYPVMKQILKVIGIKLTKETFAKTASKVVPVIGGAISGGLTYASFKPSAERLRRYLRHLPASGITEPEAQEKSDVDEAIDQAARQISTVGDAVASGAQEAMKNIASGVQAAGSVIAEGAQNAGDALAEGAQAAGSAIADGAQAAGGVIIDGAKGIGNAANDAAQAIGGFFSSFGKK